MVLPGNSNIGVRLTSFLIAGEAIWRNQWVTPIPDRSQRVDGYLRRIIARKLTRIELRDDSIESPGMNGLELRGIDAPLIHEHTGTHTFKPRRRSLRLTGFPGGSSQKSGGLARMVKDNVSVPMECSTIN